ncbi:Protein of unknown function [Gryllus bimaculatus]|nr:Protein of unknown function [Gryllus bimaculatus]
MPLSEEQFDAFAQELRMADGLGSNGDGGGNDSANQDHQVQDIQPVQVVIHIMQQNQATLEALRLDMAARAVAAPMPLIVPDIALHTGLSRFRRTGSGQINGTVREVTCTNFANDAVTLVENTEVVRDILSIEEVPMLKRRYELIETDKVAVSFGLKPAGSGEAKDDALSPALQLAADWGEGIPLPNYRHQILLKSQQVAATMDIIIEGNK